MKKRFPRASFLSDACGKKLFFIPASFKSLFLSGMVVIALFLPDATQAEVSSLPVPGNENEKKVYRKACKHLAKEEYEKARKKYLELLEIVDDDPLYYFETGICFLFSGKNRDASLKYFEKALRYSKNDTVPELYYYLGNSYILNKQYEKAKQALQNFIPYIITSSEEGEQLKNEVRQLMQSCEYALAHKTDTTQTRYYQRNLAVNTEYPEYAPVYNDKQGVLLFTSRRPDTEGNKKAWDGKYYEDIYIAKQENDKWKLFKGDKAEYLPFNTNSEKHDAGIIFSKNNKNLYLYKNDLVWKSTFKGGEWTKARLIDLDINDRKEHIPSLAVTPDGKTLYFSSNRKGGKGGYDLYKTSYTSDSSWTKPENLGKQINTRFDEDAPYITEDGKTLFFASKGHKGYGGYDIFKSQLRSGSWSKAENMGRFLNSPGDDIYLVANSKADSGFLSSNKPGGKGEMDIYYFSTRCPSLKNTFVKGIVLFDGKPAENTVISLYDNKGKNLSEKQVAVTGEYSFELEPEKQYKLTLGHNNVNHDFTFTLPEQCDTFDLYQQVELQRDSLGSGTVQIATVHHAFFDVEKAREEKELDSYRSLLKSLIPDNVDHYGFDRDTAAIEEAAIASAGQDGKPEDSDAGEEFSGTYTEYFSYNEVEPGKNKAHYRKLLRAVKQKVDKEGKAVIHIEASASRVPTQTYSSNESLAEKRALKAKETLIESFKQMNISSREVSFPVIKASVNGPEYSKDPHKRNAYGKYQYSKITLQ